ncbi:MAG: carboxypeptidase-like regulatory domain-containing protein [Bacteroidales bacterium]
MSRLSFHLLFPDYLVAGIMLTSLLLATACEKDPVPLTTNSVITGNVRTGNYDRDSITVVATGPYGKTSVLADLSGNFTFAGLGNGTYCLDYAKEGYGTIRQYNIQLFGGDTVRLSQVVLYEKPGPENLPTLKKAYIGIRPRSGPEHQWICIDTSIPRQYADSYIFQFALCLHTDKNVSWDNCRMRDFTWTGQYNGDSYSLYIDFTYMSDFPFRSGETVYIKGYPCNKSEAGGYLDTYLGIRLYSTLDLTRSTNIISFEMP